MRYFNNPTAVKEKEIKNHTAGFFRNVLKAFYCMCGAGWAEKAIISAVYIRTVSLLTFQEVLGHDKETCRGDHISITLLAPYPLQLTFNSLTSLLSHQNNYNTDTE